MFRKNNPVYGKLSGDIFRDFGKSADDDKAIPGRLNNPYEQEKDGEGKNTIIIRKFKNSYLTSLNKKIWLWLL